MKKQFDWNAFQNRQNNVIVRCRTEKEAIDFCKAADEAGFLWASGASLLDETNWYDHGPVGIYYGYEGKWHNHKRIVYDVTADVFDDNRHKLIRVEWADYMSSKDKPTKDINYDITKELNDISIRMYGTNFEQDRCVIGDAISLITQLREQVKELTDEEIELD